MRFCSPAGNKCQNNVAVNALSRNYFTHVWPTTFYFILMKYHNYLHFWFQNPNISAIGCETKNLANFPIPKKDLFPICFTKSQSSGQFMFPAVPSGDYHIFSYYEGPGATKFDVQPSLFKFSVGKDSLHINTVFQVGNRPLKVVWIKALKARSHGLPICLSGCLTSRLTSAVTFGVCQVAWRTARQAVRTCLIQHFLSF